MDALQELAALMQALCSADQATRGGAEQQFVAAKAHPNVLLPGLVQLLKAGHPDVSVTLQAGIQLKRILAKHSQNDPYDGLTPENKAGVNSGLLQVLVGEVPNLVRKQVEGAISTLGSRLLDYVPEKPKGGYAAGQEAPAPVNLWPELFPFLFDVVTKGNADMMCSVLSIFGTLSSVLLDSQVFRENFTSVGEMFSVCLAHDNSQVRKSAVEATSTVSQILTVDDFLAPFATLVPALMKTLERSLTEGKPDDAQEILTALTAIAENSSDFYVKSGCLNNVFAAMMSVSTSEGLADEVRHVAVEFMVSFAESDSREVKKVPGFVDRIVPFLMNWMLTPADINDVEWGNTIDEDEEISNYDVGLEGLDRLAVAIGGKAFSTPLNKEILQYFAAGKNDWRYRHAAILALSQTAEGCRKQFSRQLASMVAQVLEHFKDEHPRVRYVSVQCIAQFCTDFQPEFQAAFADLVLPAVTHLLNDPIPRIRHHAAATIVNFCDEAQPSLYEKHLEKLLVTLYQLLERKDQPLFINEQALSAVSAVAENAGKMFAQFYDNFMPIMRGIISLPENKDTRLSKGKAIECVSFMAIAAGKERFCTALPGQPADSDLFTQYMHRISQAGLEDDDPRSGYLFQAWARLAQCIGPAFAQYLEVVLPPLMERIKNEDDVAVLDNDEEVDDEDVQCIRLAIKGHGEKKLAIRTSLLEDKTLSLGLILSYFKTLGVHMYPYVQLITEHVVPLVSNPYLDEIREAAAQSCPLLLICTKEANPGNPQPVRMLLQHIVPKLIQALREEAETSVAGTLMENLNESISTCGEECLGNELLQGMLGTLKELFEDALQRRSSVVAEHREQEGDEDEQAKLDEQAEAEENLLTQCVECCGQLIKTHHGSFLPLFTQGFLPYFTQMLDTKKFSGLEHKLSLCLLDDFLEFGQDVAAPYFQSILGALLTFAYSEDPDVVQASCYGLGVSAQWIAAKPGQRALPDGALKQALDALKRVCSLEPAGDKAAFWQAPICNGVSALLKILSVFRGQPGVSDAEILPGIFALLPVQGDDLEAQVVHQEIFGYVASQNPVVMGENNCNLPYIRNVAGELLKTADEEEPLINEATKAQLLALFPVQA
eukprot:Hpha_TRINITY_DN15365_c3_g3::TRINITY_DN15365_c3_g3_i1::g.89947::m.89947/K20222/IPO5, KPNB3, RANBP5; importin-5